MMLEESSRSSNCSTNETFRIHICRDDHFSKAIFEIINGICL
jgi:hypothetical protein